MPWGALVGTGKVLAKPAFLPSDIAGLLAWYDANAITGLVNNDPVTTWADRRGAGPDATQGTAAKKPLFKTAILNGLPVVRFDGVDDLLVATVTLNQPKTVIVVTRLLAGGGTNQYVLDGQATNAQVVGTAGTGGQMVLYAGDTLSVACTETNWNIFMGEFNGVSSAISVNGVRTTGGAGATNATGLTLGNSGGETIPLNGDIAEVLVYNTQLNAAQRAQVETYLNDKWAVY